MSKRIGFLSSLKDRSVTKSYYKIGEALVDGKIFQFETDKSLYL